DGGRSGGSTGGRSGRRSAHSARPSQFRAEHGQGGGATALTPGAIAIDRRRRCVRCNRHMPPATATKTPSITSPNERAISPRTARNACPRKKPTATKLAAHSPAAIKFSRRKRSQRTALKPSAKD